MKRLKRLAVVLILLLICLGVPPFLLWAPEWMANQYAFDNLKDWAAQVSANRTLLVNFVGGVAIAVTIYFTYRNFKVSQENLRVAEQNIKIAQVRLVTESFSKAVEQLGNAQMSVRLGGIYTLDQIARDHESQNFRIMQILTGHIRHLYRNQKPTSQTDSSELSPGASGCPVEVQAILASVGERYWPPP